MSVEALASSNGTGFGHGAGSLCVVRKFSKEVKFEKRKRELGDAPWAKLKP